MARPRDGAFSSVVSEGGLLPPDLLGRIASGDSGVPGLDPTDYHLPPRSKLNEAVSRSWNVLLAHWRAFAGARQKLPPTDPGTGVTREKWLLPLFQELGYGRLPLARSLEVEGKSFPISHRWREVPIHLIGCGIDFDKRTPGAAGAARSSPHSLVQDYLNRSEAALWGFVSNGLRLRLLRDSASLTRQAYVEFDFETMMEGEAFSDFSLFWLVCHESRLEAESTPDLWLERWSKLAADQGARALDVLRQGVEEGIRALGTGFLANPSNERLREKLRSGELLAQDFYRELLRLVYRLIFLFVAEDRGLLLVPDSDDAAVGRYTRWYSTRRLRDLADMRRGTQHPDLYAALRLVMEKLDDGCSELALPGLGSFLWSPVALPNLRDASIANRDLLDAVRALCFLEQDGVRRRVDYRNLGAEELGSVYEALLELHPMLDIGAGSFELSTAAGHERKTTGSYYTPTSLVEELLNSALDPVLGEAAKSPEPEKAILALKVCDPAVGSGHFLIAAAHRIARRLASIRSGEVEPTPDTVRAALRDVVGHCLYGVDQNSMAVELCKVNLWLEAMEPGKPLSFLDHRIQLGNSLLGATPKLLADGIPDSAFEAIEGDDKKFTQKLKKENSQEREGQRFLPLQVADAAESYSDLSRVARGIDSISESSLKEVRRKEAVWRAHESSPELRRARLAADAWCAAFVWNKEPEAPGPVTQEIFLALQDEPTKVSPATVAEVQRLAAEYCFFHWHLAFPNVFRLAEHEKPANEETGWSGGFDVLLGNPPWDTLSPDAKEFFSAYDPQIRFEDKTHQDQTIARLVSDPVVARAWEASSRFLYAQVHFFKHSGRYELFAPGNLGKGDFNVYRMFVETGIMVVRPAGMLAQFVPENLYNGANAMAIRRVLIEHFEWKVLLGFENTREIWFRGVHTAAKFCLYVARKGGRTEAIHAAFNVSSLDDLKVATSSAALRIPVRLIGEFSPDALAIMELSSQDEIDIVTKMYLASPKFGDEAAGPPHRHYMREVDMGTDRELFSEDPTGLPLYEGRMVDAFDHRAKAYQSGRGRAAEWIEQAFGDAEKGIRPQWYVLEAALPKKLGNAPRRYRVGFCDVASPTNERTLAAALIPPNCICGDKVPTISFESGYEWGYMVFLAVANSHVMDFLARKKVSLKMSYTVLDSLPFPRLSSDHPQARRLVEVGARLTCTGPEMRGYWDGLARNGWLPALAPSDPLPGFVDEVSRQQARAELDALVARYLFSLSHEELAYVLDTFPIIRRKDEKKYGDYRTKLVILDNYDRMQEAIDSGVPYQTLLDPLPGDPGVAHPKG